MPPSKGGSPAVPFSERLDGVLLLPCGSGALLPMTGRKHQFAIVACNLYNICVDRKDQGVNGKE